MKIYCDENIEPAITESLRRRGLEVLSSREMGVLGKDDEYHLRRASELGAVILTHDVDFLRLAHEWRRAGKSHNGILYANLLKLSHRECVALVELAPRVLTEEELKDYIEFL